jgi:glycosyltransferase involved in cell wall biosynthesis
MIEAESNIIVSISCTTFNHGPFIRRCLEGFLMQETNFEFEILVHDDASTDQTQEVIKEMERSNPTRIKSILQTENQYSKGERGMMMRFNFPRARGKYIAICEGDDYWTDPLKLQKQVDFLENNPDYVLCFHDVDVLMPDGEVKHDFITKVPEKSEELATLAKSGNYIHTPSVIFRNRVQNMPDYTVKATIGDYFLYCFLGQFGKFKHLQESMAVYRYGVGVWSQQSEFKRHFYTHITNALLAKYYYEIQRKDISDHFEERIGLFILNHSNQIEKEHIELLSSTPTFNSKLSWMLLEDKNRREKELETIKRQTLEYTSVASLVRTITQRLIRKIKK